MRDVRVAEDEPPRPEDFRQERQAEEDRDRQPGQERASAGRHEASLQSPSCPRPRPGNPSAGRVSPSVAGFAVLSVYFTGFFPPFGNPNELSRLEAVYAFVEQGTFSIDGAIPVLGDHEDKAVSGGHFYSNKAPGLTFAAIPVYRALRVFFPAPKSPWDAVFVLVRILTVSLLSTLAAGEVRRASAARQGRRPCSSSP